MRQFFRLSEIIAEESNTIDYALVSCFLKGKHAFIVAAHTYQEHILNRILTQIPYHLEFYSAKSHTQHNTFFNKASTNYYLINKCFLFQDSFSFVINFCRIFLDITVKK